VPTRDVETTDVLIEKMTESDTATEIEPPENEDVDAYQDMLEDLDTAIDEVNRKIENGRIRNPEHDKVRIKYYRALGYLVRSRLKVIEQRDLQEMEERLRALEDDKDVTGGIQL
jgi:hypothetical protein